MKGFVLMLMLLTPQWTIKPNYTSPPVGGVFPAVDCSQTAMLDAFNQIEAAGQDGATLLVPAGTCHWTAMWRMSPTVSMTIQGAGAVSSTGGMDGTTTGIDLTQIIDDTAHSNPASTSLIVVDIIPGKTFRFTGMSFKYGDTNTSIVLNGLINLTGETDLTATPAGSIRADHMSFYNIKTLSFKIGKCLYGVIDHSYFVNIQNQINTNHGNCPGEITSGNNGALQWALPPDFGTARYVFIEDNVFSQFQPPPGSRSAGALNDCDHGGRQTIRYNNAVPSGVQGHQMQGGISMGCRVLEIYKNNFNYTTFSAQNQIPKGEAVFTRTGTGLFWGNICNNCTGMITFMNDRVQLNSGSYGADPTQGFMMCGGPPRTGFVDMTTSGDVSLVSGMQFDTTLEPIPSPPPATVWGPPISINGKWCPVIRVIDGSHLTVRTTGTSGTCPTPTTNLSNVAYYTGSSWDENLNSYGNACIAQSGRGQGDFLQGVFPNAINTALTSGGTPGTFTITNPGSGYTAGDIVTLPPGTAQLRLTGTTLTGAVLHFAGTSVYSLNQTVSVSGGTGSGGQITITGLMGWPRQKLEPWYIFGNTYIPGGSPNRYATANWNAPTATGVDTATTRPNRDFYTDCHPTYGAICGGPGGTFNGDAGTGEGTFAQRPTTCTPQVAYWATDQQNLYQCSATNTWTLYYHPYIYPHPLQAQLNATAAMKKK